MKLFRVFCLMLILTMSAGCINGSSHRLDMDSDRHYIYLSDSLSNSSVRDSAATSQSYENLMRDMKMEQQKSFQLKIYGIIVILVITISLVLILHYSRKAYYNGLENSARIIDSLEETVKNQNSRLSFQSARHQKLMEDIHELLSTRFNTIDNLCQIYFQHSGDKDKAKIYNEVMSIITSISESPEMMHELEYRIDKYCDNIITRMRDELPLLKEWEIQLFVFIILGFSSQSISVFQSISIDNVYGRKSALKRKIASSDASSKDEFLKYF